MVSTLRALGEERVAFGENCWLSGDHTRTEMPVASVGEGRGVKPVFAVSVVYAFSKGVINNSETVWLSVCVCAHARVLNVYRL